MSESDKPLHQQIDDAMEAIRHQVERLREGPTMGEPSNDLGVIADLKRSTRRSKGPELV